jgi:hypothetical protein
MDKADKVDEMREGEHVPIPAGHHYAAPEVEEWKPHPYEEVGVGRKESLKGDLPDVKEPEKRE